MMSSLPPRLPSEGLIAGVIAGLAAHFRVNVKLLRLIAVVGLVAGVGSLAVVYIALWILMPTSP